MPARKRKSDEIEVPEDTIVRAAQVRSRALGKPGDLERAQEVATRPNFREPIEHAYREGWMDALIYLEERRSDRNHVQGRGA